MSVRVVVADDHELLRAGLVTVLDSSPELEVVAQVADGPAAVRAAREHRPDLVLMDVEMPGGDGITATREVVALGGVRVLILTMFDLDEYVVAGLRAGASGFLVKTTEPRALIRAVLACAAGQATIAADVLDRVVRPALAGRREVPALARLTGREHDVLRAMARGLSNAEIGQELYLAETTVKTHVAHVLAKLGVPDRVQAVVLALQAGL